MAPGLGSRGQDVTVAPDGEDDVIAGQMEWIHPPNLPSITSIELCMYDHQLCLTLSL